MKKLFTMMWILFVINLVMYIVALWVSLEKAIILYRMENLCNLGIFVPSLTLIHKEIKKNKFN